MGCGHRRSWTFTISEELLMRYQPLAALFTRFFKNLSCHSANETLQERDHSTRKFEEGTNEDEIHRMTGFVDVGIDTTPLVGDGIFGISQTTVVTYIILF